MKCLYCSLFNKAFYYVGFMPLRHRSRRQIFRFTNVIRQQDRQIHNSDNNIMEDMRINAKLSERLSPLVRPQNYKLELRPNMDAGDFTGSVCIDVVVRQEKNYINLHSIFLNIANVKVCKGEDEVTVAKFVEIKLLEQLFIHFEGPLSPGNYKIFIDFSGDLTRNIVGLYSSRLLDSRY